MWYVFPVSFNLSNGTYCRFLIIKDKHIGTSHKDILKQLSYEYILFVPIACPNNIIWWR